MPCVPSWSPGACGIPWESPTHGSEQNQNSVSPVFHNQKILAFGLGMILANSIREGVAKCYLSLSSSTDNSLAVAGACNGRHSHTVGIVNHQHQTPSLRGEQTDLPIIPGCDRPKAHHLYVQHMDGQVVCIWLIYFNDRRSILKPKKANKANKHDL